MSTSNALSRSIKQDAPFENTIDEHLQQTILMKTIGEVLSLHEKATNAKALFVAHLIFDSVFNYDIQSLKQIISRVDGGVPDAQKRRHYANIFGDAIEDVLSYTNKEDLKIQPDDICIIAMAKVVVWVSMSDPGKNLQKKKDKQDAIQIILERTGGRKSEPTKQLATTNYVNPEWMQGLPSSTE